MPRGRGCKRPASGVVDRNVGETIYFEALPFAVFARKRINAMIGSRCTRRSLAENPLVDPGHGRVFVWRRGVDRANAGGSPARRRRSIIYPNRRHATSTGAHAFGLDHCDGRLRHQISHKRPGRFRFFARRLARLAPSRRGTPNRDRQ